MDFKTIEGCGSAEITEKKSRFIADCFSVSSEEEAAGYIEAVKRKYHDARHHCWAYVIRQVGQPKERFSDDGEPAGTAGKPILDVIKGVGLKDVLIVVTRYFGGVLLGTGKLARAYMSAAREGLRLSRVLTKVHGFQFAIKTDYPELGKIQYILKNKNIPVLDASYTDIAELIVFVSKEEQGVISCIAEETDGNAVIERRNECWYGKN